MGSCERTVGVGVVDQLVTGGDNARHKVAIGVGPLAGQAPTGLDPSVGEGVKDGWGIASIQFDVEGERYQLSGGGNLIDRRDRWCLGVLRIASHSMVGGPDAHEADASSQY